MLRRSEPQISNPHVMNSSPSEGLTVTCLPTARGKICSSISLAAQEQNPKVLMLGRMQFACPVLSKCWRPSCRTFKTQIPSHFGSSGDLASPCCVQTHACRRLPSPMPPRPWKGRGRGRGGAVNNGPAGQIVAAAPAMADPPVQQRGGARQGRGQGRGIGRAPPGTSLVTPSKRPRVAEPPSSDDPRLRRKLNLEDVDEDEEMEQEGEEEEEEQADQDDEEDPPPDPEYDEWGIGAEGQDLEDGSDAEQSAAGNTPTPKPAEKGGRAVHLNCSLCKRSTKDGIQWYQHLRTVDGDKLAWKPTGSWCWTCGAVRESFQIPGMTDESFTNQMQADPSMRAKVQAALDALHACNRKPPAPQVCTRTSQVVIGKTSGVRLRWELAFVTEDNFSVFFKMPPSSVPGVSVVSLNGINGEPIAGVLMQMDGQFPPDVPYSVAEVYTKTKLFHLDFVHDKGDVHVDHGDNIFNVVLTDKLSKQASELQSSKNITNVPTWETINSKVTALQQKRAEEAARSVDSPGGEASEPAVVVSGSRLQAALSAAPAPVSAAVPAKRIARKLKLPDDRISCPPPPPPQILGGSSARSSASTATMVAASGLGGRRASESSRRSSASLVDSFEPGAPAASAASASGRSKCSSRGTARCGSEVGDKVASVVKLGGVRGLSKVISIEDVLAGYNPGRELSAV